MDENLNQQNFGGINNGGRPMPPPPPPPEITLRTMQSDIESIKQTGGENPVPKPFTPPEIKKQPNMELEDLSKEEGMIRTGNGDGVLPPSEPPKNKTKALVLVLVLLLVIAGAGFAGYKYIYPMFRPAMPAVVINETPITPVPETVVPENITPEPIVSEPATSLPAGELATTTTPETIPTPEPAVLKPHMSLLTTSADLTVPLGLSAPVSLASLKELLIAEAAKKPETATALKEVNLSDQGGQLVFANVFPLFLPAFTPAELAPLFEEDFTTVISYDSNGAWLGMVAKFKEGADLVATKALIAKMETSADLANLYIADPGTPAVGGFKDGKANNLPVRYLNFSKTGASLDYGWTSNNLLVISTSYNGAKAILTKLGVQ